MLSFLARRVVGLLVTLVVTAAVVFLVLEVLPGDPATTMLGLNATPEAVAQLNREFGLDRPVAERFLTWLAGLATGDLGLSYTYRVPVAGLIAERMTVTLPLAAAGVTLACLIGVPLGLLAASRAGSGRDLGVMVFAQIGLAVPNFWFGILLVLLFAVGLGWLPSGGFPGWDQGLLPGLRALLLPTLALALPESAIVARVTRSAVLDTLGEDWVRTARAKGLAVRRVLFGHVLRNAAVPIVTILGVRLSFLVAGALIVIESVFTLPGLGRLVFQAIAQRDVIVVKNVVVVFAAMVVVINFLVDVAYGVIDPRLRQASR